MHIQFVVRIVKRKLNRNNRNEEEKKKKKTQRNVPTNCKKTWSDINSQFSTNGREKKEEEERIKTKRKLQNIKR